MLHSLELNIHRRFLAKGQSGEGLFEQDGKSSSFLTNVEVTGEKKGLMNPEDCLK